ncbi:hypothetical protein C4577_01645 [Candidatus Parcubacteria bacterium]|nr:MAG: hypothetical protein C4577_01645 [Candidatus Parcubacteria bacterium]
MFPEETSELVEKSYHITDYPSEVQEDWLKKIGQNLKSVEELEGHLIMLQAKVLYHVWEIWDSTNNHEGRSLSLEAKAPWQHDFYKWAKAYTKRRATREPHKTTIDNKIITYKDWKAEGLIEYPEYVFVPKRDDYGQLLQPDLTKEEAWEAVKFDPNDCEYGKLSICRVAAKRNQMSPEAWSALRDPYATENDLQGALAGDRTRNRHREDDYFLSFDNGLIYACTVDGCRVDVLQVIYENEGDELFKKALSHILTAAGLPVPLELQP